MTSSQELYTTSSVGVSGVVAARRALAADHADAATGFVAPAAPLAALVGGPAGPLTVTLLGTIFADPTRPLPGGAEIVAASSNVPRVFVTNAATNLVDCFDISDPTNPVKAFDIGRRFASDYDLTSVDVRNGLIAAAYEGNEPGERSIVAFWRGDRTFYGAVEVGDGLDSVAFTPNRHFLVAVSEGERQVFQDAAGRDFVDDPDGSVTIINTFVPRGDLQERARTINFSQFSGQEEALRAEGVRITAGKKAAQDFEPESVAISPDGKTAAVTLQENNAIMLIDLKSATVIDIVGLGTKNHNLAGNGLDASDRDSGINIENYPVQGLYQPDGITGFTSGGRTYWAIANEGDARDGETARVSTLTLDPGRFPDAAALQANSALGRLEVFGREGDTDGDGDVDILYVPGGRSFSIIDDRGDIIFDSGDEFEQITAELIPEFFNSTNDDNDSFDNRSDNKGPEPEGITTGTINGVTYAFIGLERVGGFMMYDLTNPARPEFVQYVNNRDFSVDAETLAAGDLGPEGLEFIPAADNPSGKNLLAVANEVSGSTSFYAIEAPANFRLQLLHAGDLEGGVDTVDFAPNFAAIVDFLDADPNTLVLSAGDNFIPGPFFNAAGDLAAFRTAGVFNQAYNALFDLPADVNGDGAADAYAGLREGAGRADITVMNAIGFQASVLGNHELDAGTGAFADIIRQNYQGPGLANDQSVGALFPYLSANLDFSGDANLSGIFTSAILPNTAFASGPAQSLANVGTPKLAPATTIEVGGETIGVLGATTQLLERITSAGGVQVIGPEQDDMPALAAILQPTIDALRAQGINKIVLLTQLQQISNEKLLATLLDGVDIIVAGGSNTIQADAGDELLPGDTADEGYPFITQSAVGENVLVLSTDGNYEYVGRLVAEFDYKGRILLDSLDPAQNGPIAATAANVAELWGSLDAAFAEGTRGDIVRDVVNAVDGVIAAQDGNILGSSTVFLEGRRDLARTQETNLGDLTSDANLWYSQQVDDTVQVSIKNGGGIRFQIGEVGDGGVLLPTEANPDAGKAAGDISQLDVANSLRFNNALSLVTVTTEQLLQVIEHGVAAVAPGATPGQFPQIGGLAFSYDPSRAAGDRVSSLAIVDEAGNLVRALVDDYAVLPDAAGDPIRVVTLSFLLTGGDNYPFQAFIAANPGFANVVNLGGPVPAGFPDVETFAAFGTEQDAFAEYLQEFYAVPGSPFDLQETPAAEDFRIQNLLLRTDTVDDLFL